MSSLSKFNLILFRPTNITFSSFPTTHSFTDIYYCMESMDYLRWSMEIVLGSSILKYSDMFHIWICSIENTFPPRDHIMQHFIFQNIFFPKDFTGSSAENFPLIIASTAGICLHIFHGTIQLFIVTKATFIKWYHISWRKSNYYSCKTSTYLSAPGYSISLYLTPFNYTGETKGRTDTFLFHFSFADFKNKNTSQIVMRTKYQDKYVSKISILRQKLDKLLCLYNYKYEKLLH